MLNNLSTEIKQYLVVTGNYWAFTLTDGALRMLVVLHFYQLGYGPLAIASLFLFYEIFGVVTNLFGGWLGARIGLNKTMNIGLALQVFALSMMVAPNAWLSVGYVMLAQALSGIAKDLNKMSAKSSIKGLLKADQQTALYKWIAILTGSKNALKGAGFFLGGALLSLLGFQLAMAAMASVLLIVFLVSVLLLNKDLGKAKYQAKFSQVFSKTNNVNVLSAARLFLFAARDVWFVIALPLYLATTFNWQHWQVGSFIACWIIGYGVVQGFAPKITKNAQQGIVANRLIVLWASILTLVTFLLAFSLSQPEYQQMIIIVGLLFFGGVFAVNSSLHSYMIVRFAKADGTSLDVGFYYMANAMGRLIGTVLSGYVFQVYGFVACLYISAFFLLLTVLISTRLKTEHTIN